MNRVNKLDVFIGERKVGTMAHSAKYVAAFEYDAEWIAEGFSISPFSLPLEKGVHMPKIDPFEGLFGVFADSLPDGWGRLIVDRLMKSKGMDPHTLSSMDRLSIVGDAGMGALSYKPVSYINEDSNQMSLDEIAKECECILNSQDSSNLDYLFKYGGSPGGARPKILTHIGGEDWLIKFPAKEDGYSIGRQEYDYAMCARECGISMSEVRLFESNICEGYFGTKRFDICNGDSNDRIHMVTVSGLLETSHRIPNLDYELLMRLTLELTKSMDECLKLYRLMCFNVFAHNRDDHAKNFTFQYIEKERRWMLSPAYDLTYSNSIGGEHATTICGNGVNPGMQDILQVAKCIGINKSKAHTIAKDIEECVHEKLKEYIK